MWVQEVNGVYIYKICLGSRNAVFEAEGPCLKVNFYLFVVACVILVTECLLVFVMSSEIR